MVWWEYTSTDFTRIDRIWHRNCSRHWNAILFALRCLISITSIFTLYVWTFIMRNQRTKIVKNVDHRRISINIDLDDSSWRSSLEMAPVWKNRQFHFFLHIYVISFIPWRTGIILDNMSESFCNITPNTSGAVVQFLNRELTRLDKTTYETKIYDKTSSAFSVISFCVVMKFLISKSVLQKDSHFFNNFET